MISPPRIGMIESAATCTLVGSRVGSDGCSGVTVRIGTSIEVAVIAGLVGAGVVLPILPLSEWVCSCWRLLL